MDGIAERADELRRRIARAGGDPGAITLVAVTKGMGADVARSAVAAGLVDLGENYGQELLAKAAGCRDRVRWHFLGAVQRRKVRDLAAVVHLWQGVDRLVAGQEIARHAPRAAVLVQVNLSGLPGRNGCRFEEAPALVDGLRGLGLDVRGLMAVGAPDDPRPGFRRLARLAADLDLRQLSMGMSSDLDVAVEEGSTMVRVGTALFGRRPSGTDIRRYPHPEGGR